MITFAVASLACAAAPSLPPLLAARARQGVGAGLMLPQGLAIAAHAFPESVDRARATAAWAITAATSTAIGPVLGGVLTDTLGWGYIFWIEQRHHLSGALGPAVLDRFVDADWVKRMPRGRAVKVTPEGRTALADWFGVDWTD